MTKVTYLVLGVNVTEIPENVMTPPNGTESLIQELWFNNFNQKMTVKAGAFQNLKQIQRINFRGKFNKIEKGAFRFNQRSDTRLSIYFIFGGDFTGDVIENGTFDWVQRPVVGFFDIGASLDYLPEGVFKTILIIIYHYSMMMYDVANKLKAKCTKLY